MNSHPRIAIVTDGLWRKSLSTIRSLGKAGFQVYVMGDTILTTGFWSKFTTGRIIAPLAKKDPVAFMAALENALKDLPGQPVVFPMEDATIVCVSQHRQRLSKKARFVLPDHQALVLAENKAETLKLAQKLQIPCPKTWFPSSPTALHSKLSKLSPNKYIVKPYSGSGSSGIVYQTHRSLAEWQHHWKIHGPLIIQEKIPSTGDGLGASFIFDQKGICQAAFAHQRLQQYPNSGGPSTDRKAVTAPEIIQHSQKLLTHLKWRGIAMVEWKVDPRTNQALLMEINPRFWGSLELAVRAGVNFPLLYANAALHNTQTPISTYKVGTRCRWLIPGDILRYLTQAPNQRESLFSFMSTLALAEEWDEQDIPGCIATIVCSVGLALNPQYWKYLKRG